MSDEKFAPKAQRPVVYGGEFGKLSTANEEVLEENTGVDTLPVADVISQANSTDQATSNAFAEATNQTSDASDNAPSVFLPVHSTSETQVTPVMPVTAEVTTGKPKRKRRRPGWFALIVAVVVASLLGASLGMYAVQLRYQGARPVAIPVAAKRVEPVVTSQGETPDWQAVAETVGGSVVAIRSSNGETGGSGSGVIIDEAGHILTNEHVISNAEEITVTLADGRLYHADIVGFDAATDLAVISLRNAPDNLSVAALGNSDELQVGQAVTAIGNPLGLSHTMTTGIISALNRPVQTVNAQSSTGEAATVLTNAVQIDAAVNPGNSGGPVFDAQGRVIAIASSIASTSTLNGSGAGNIGIGFGIPINLAKNIANQLIENGVAKHAYLGVRIKDGIAQYGNEARLGALVESVEEGTPAAKGNIQSGDVIVGIDGHAVVSAASLTGYVRQYSAGDMVTLRIARNGELQEIDVTLAVRAD